jgi:hypothetical protein
MVEKNGKTGLLSLVNYKKEYLTYLVPIITNRTTFEFQLPS